MIIDVIKQLLGEDLTVKVEEALKGKGKDGKDVDLVVGNDGSFVPASKYDALKSEKEAADKLAENVQKELTDLKATDPEKLKTDLAAAQAQAKTLKDQYDKDLAAVRLDAALDSAIYQAKGRNAKAIKAMLDIAKLSLADDGTVKGLDLETVKKSDPYLFEDEKEDPDEPKFFGMDPGGKPRIASTGDAWEKQIDSVFNNF